MSGDGHSVKRNTDYKPLFPWFGGKSPVADVVWSALGDVKNYVEPFAGSAAVLFLRPGGAGPIETINDADGFVSNAWRSVKNNPDAVAKWADEMVSECEVHARHLWLLGDRERLTEKLCGDVDFYDAKAAGFWIYGLCCWIGSGWCSGKGPWISENGELTLRNSGQGVNRTATPAPGRQREGREPETSGVSRQRPVLDRGKRGLLQTSGTESRSDRRTWLIEYLAKFSERLARVRVCCGDWSRVCGPSVTFRHGMTGVFLDPPYADSATRTTGLYATDCEQVAHAVREWAIEQDENPLMRIVLAGYDGEHNMPATWRVHEWEAVGGYGLIADDEEATGRANKCRERLWFSPACIKPRVERTLFSEKESA